jgi:hypothetical protein
MAKYNILDEDDIFSESGGDDDAQERKKKEKEPEEPEINIDGEELFDDSLLVDKKEQEEPVTDEEFFDKQPDEDIELDIQEEQGQPEHDEKLKDFFRDEDQEQGYDPPEPAPARSEAKEPSEVHHIIEEYEDEKLQGLNYKPFVIGGVIIILLVAAYFALDLWILGGGDQAPDEVVEQTVPQEPQLTPEQIRKNQQLAQLAGRTNRELSLVNNIIGITGNQGGNLSGLLLYDKYFILEIFGKDRSELARTQKALQAGVPGQRFEIVSAETRPGEDGGIFGLYSLVINSETPSQDVSQKLSSVQEAKNWLNNLSSTNGLNVGKLTETQTRNVGNFRVMEIETIITGSLESCKKALTEIARAATNLKIHKLNMTNTDQSNFSPSRMRVQLILQLYV